jgi:hypothetical protein
MEHPLRPIVTGWLAKIKLAMDWKRAKFQDDADEAMRFFNGPYDFMYSKKYVASSRGFSMDEEADVPTPTFRMTVNKVAEMVQLFGPVLYHKNPVRQVNPRKAPMIPIEALGDPNNPMVQQLHLFLQQQVGSQRAVDQARATLLEFYLNYTPNELGLKDEARAAIDEAIIKGMGVLWTELYKSPGSQIKMIGSFYDTVDNLAIDSDMETIKAAQWIARRCVHPVWQVEQEYGLAPGSLTGNLESLRSQGETAGDEAADYNRRRGQTNDLLVYWKVYSKMGMDAQHSRFQLLVEALRQLPLQESGRTTRGTL